MKLPKGARKYLRTLKGKTLIVKLGGYVIKDPESMDLVSEDIAILKQVGIRVIVVHGGGPQVDELARKMGHTPIKVEGRRVTDAAALEITKMIFGGKINTDLLVSLRKFGVKVVGLSGVDGNLIKAKKREAWRMKLAGKKRHELVDFGFVGDVIGVDTAILRLLVKSSYTPVIASLGSDDEGQLFNINADTVAQVIAAGMKAEKLINLSNVKGVMRDQKDPSSLISVLDVDEAEEMIRGGGITEGMIPKIRASINAVHGGVRRTHIIDGTKRHSLLNEMLTFQGTGTMILDKKEKEKYLHERTRNGD